MAIVYAFMDLLRRDGADLPLRPRGKGRCGHCEGKSRTLSVDLPRELAHCFRCGWGCNRPTLEKALGITSTVITTTADRRKARVIRHETAEFTEWVRGKRIGTAALLCDLFGYELEWREVGCTELAETGAISENTWKMILRVTAWMERAGSRYEQLSEIESNAPELYAEFVGGKVAA
jgi:hypothetical protein